MKTSLLIIALFLASFTAHSQEEDHGKNEVGLSTGYFLMQPEGVSGLGFHLHYNRLLAEDFGIGGGVETIFGSHGHTTISILAVWMPVEDLKLSLGPGFTIPTSEEESMTIAHVEATYSFKVGKIHLGPYVGVGKAKVEYHISAGLHLGYDF
jgi:hypothetical protein